LLLNIAYLDIFLLGNWPKRPIYIGEKKNFLRNQLCLKPVFWGIPVAGDLILQGFY